MRILFLSDTHLGLDLPHRPRVARRRGGADFFESFERALAPALAGAVDVVLHGGDLHFRSRVAPWLSEAALAPLKRVADRGVPVLLVPGNHERSRLPYPLLARHPHLHVFDRPRTVQLEARGLRVAFAGFPYASDVRARLPRLLEATGYRDQPADQRVLCMHQCVEGATCGPGDFTFRGGGDVIRRADLPTDLAMVLSGHLHRHQLLRGGPSVLYAGSVERTSFAEAGEVKGAALVTLSPGAEAAVEFRPLPARPMVICRLALAGLGRSGAAALLARTLQATPAGAVVQLRLEAPPPGLDGVFSAAALRALARDRTVSVTWPRAPMEAHCGRRFGAGAPALPTAAQTVTARARPKQ